MLHSLVSVIHYRGQVEMFFTDFWLGGHMTDYQACELTLIFEDHTETVFTMLDLNEYIEDTVFDCWGHRGLLDFKWKIVGQDDETIKSLSELDQLMREYGEALKNK